MTSKRVTCSNASLIYVVLFGLLVITKIALNASTTAAAEPTREETSTNALQIIQGLDDQPVEKVRKNIQVLKGLPESKLFSLMSFISTSLDVKCEYCHVKKEGKDPRTGASDFWIFDSDEKPKKLVARRMMKMVLDINHANFDGETFVTCYTCHRGNTNVARLPALPPREPIATGTAALPLPTAEQILAKYLAAIGGKDAAAKFKTAVIKGTVERADGNFQLDVTVKEPDKKYLVTMTSPRANQTLGVDGDAAWIKTAAGSQKLSGLLMEQLIRSAFVNYSTIKVVAQPEQMKVLSTEKIGDRETYVLALVPDRDTTTKFFFDTQTGLLLRELTIKQTMLAPLPEQVDFEDYRDVDGVKVPFTIRTSAVSTYTPTIRRLTEIRHNVAVNDDIFNLTTATPTPR